MKITVTQEHINRARREAMATHRAPCYICPVAQALMAAGNREVSVAKNYAVWSSPDGQGAWAALPGVAIDWIEAFDEGGNVQPFEFELEMKGYEE